MSLTSHLDDSGSPVREFMYRRFPNTSDLFHEIRSALKAATTLKPSIPTHSSTLGLLAMALDYRIRYYFEVTPVEQLVAYQGAYALEMRGYAPDLVSCWHEQFAPSLTEKVLPIQSNSRRLGEEEENELLRYCVILALFEQFYRTSTAWEHSPLLKLAQHELSDVLELVEPYWLDDLRTLSWMFRETCGRFLNQKVVLNPTFKGGRDVGGADADLIVNGRIFEIKTTTQENPKTSKLKEWLYQLLGYVLLDYGDDYDICGIGFYFSRQGTLLEWPLRAVLDVLVGEEAPPLEEIRADFQREALS